MSTIRVKSIESPDADPVAIPSLDKRMASAWVNFNGTGTVAINGAHNVASITDLGTGNYFINFAAAMANTGFALAGSARGNISTRAGFIALDGGTDAKSVNGVRVSSYQGADQTVVDSPDIGIAIFGGRA